MSSLGNLDSAQSREVEEQLFSTHRLQSTRHMPVALPRPDFWKMVKSLLNTLDLEIQSMLMKGITGMRLQNLQKRQANIRHIASELARKRTVAVVQHTASQSLRSASQHGGAAQELPALDWQRHDPAEKAFYHAVQIAMDRFKMEVDWSSMQDGLAGEGIALPKRHAPGTMQLDSFTESNITSRPPPALAFEDQGPEPLPEADIDEERLMGPDEWPDLDEYVHADLDEQAPVSAKTPSDADDEMIAFMGNSDGAKHAAAMELAPSKQPAISLDEAFEAPEEGDSDVKEVEPEDPPASPSLIRIRVLMTSPEPIVTASGESLALEAGDVHFVDQDSADWLIESGVAEAAAL
ncbi:MAG: hypothetical protein ACJZ40_07095 [Candidatus Poseidoniaceae archaeon]|tara:strand:- start:185 stop:1234 length:1050 start_codon:yes stop_codon:yes gene_type:complete